MFEFHTTTVENDTGDYSANGRGTSHGSVCPHGALPFPKTATRSTEVKVAPVASVNSVCHNQILMLKLRQQVSSV